MTARIGKNSDTVLAEEKRKIPFLTAKIVSHIKKAFSYALDEYGKLKAKASDFDKDELDNARKLLRSDKESETRKKIQAEYGHCDDQDFAESKDYIDKRIGEYDEPPKKEKVEEIPMREYLNAEYQQSPETPTQESDRQDSSIRRRLRYWNKKDDRNDR